MNKLHSSSSRSRQAGFTLVEMMVAITIGLVVLFGMTATFVNLKSTFKSQDSLGQLQDNERLALTFLTTAVNEAGYYPNPMAGTTIANTSLSDPWTGNMPATVGIFGAAGTGTSPTATESLQTAFASTSTDGLISCIGTSYAGAGTVTVRNVFYVDPATNSLMCKVYVNSAKTDAMANSGTAAVLISGVQSMAVTYGVASSGSQVDTYKPAASMVATDWPNVKAVRIKLMFVNPFDASKPIPRTHTINLMN
jgi:type IV pilus assembly protein PilW